MADFTISLGSSRNDGAEIVANSDAAKELLGQLFGQGAVSYRTVTSKAEDFAVFAVRARGLTWEQAPSIPSAAK